MHYNSAKVEQTGPQHFRVTVCDCFGKQYVSLFTSEETANNYIKFLPGDFVVHDGREAKPYYVRDFKPARSEV